MLCIIPARGGSKRIKRKNIKPFLGKPIIEYPTETAQEAGCQVWVSTDDSEIAGVSQAAGAIVLAREEHLAGDGIEVEDVLYSMLKASYDDKCCMMYPTSVFTKPEDLMEARDILELKWNYGYELVYSITRFSYPPQRALHIVDGEVKLLQPEHRNSQDIPVLYHDAAQFYMFDVKAFRKAWENGKRLLEMRAHGIEYANHEVQDIDTPEDWTIAEMKYKARGH